MATYIESGTGRQINDPSLADPTKFYVEMGTGTQVSGSALKGGGGTQTYTTPSGAQVQAPAANVTPPLAGTPPAGVTPPIPNKTGTPNNTVIPIPTTPPAPPPPISITNQNIKPQQPVVFTPVQSSGSSLVDFANALDQVVSKGREARNAGSLQLMQGGQGVVKASDFNSILNSLNNASASTASDLTKRALEAATPSFQTQQIGDKMYQMQYDSTGRFIGATEIASGLGSGNTFQYQTSASGQILEYQYDSNGQLIGINTVGNLPVEAVNKGVEYVPNTTRYYTDPTTGEQKFRAQLPTGEWIEEVIAGGAPPESSSGSTTGVGAPSGEMTSDQISSLKAALNSSKFSGAESDGDYSNPNLYFQNYISWVQQGGSPEYFLLKFPPKSYLNPKFKAENLNIPNVDQSLALQAYNEVMRFVVPQTTSGSSNTSGSGREL